VKGSITMNQPSRWRKPEDYGPTPMTEPAVRDDRRNSQEAFEHAVARELAGRNPDRHRSEPRGLESAFHPKLTLAFPPHPVTLLRNVLDVRRASRPNS
jgi:hypothetical protein